MAQAPQAIKFSGRFVQLAPMNVAADVAELFAISHADNKARELFTYLQRGPYQDAAEMQAALSAWCATLDVVAFVVRSADASTVLGTLSLMNTRPEHGVVEIGNVWYSPAAQRTKTNTESVYLLLRYCFDELAYRRAEWKCDTRNRPSGKTALRLGFTFEGVFRKHMLIRNRNRDSAWFSMLDDEWPSRCQAIEHWLYTDDTQPLSQGNSCQLPYP